MENCGLILLQHSDLALGKILIGSLFIFTGEEEQNSLYIINYRIYQEDKCKEQETQFIRKFEMEGFFSRDFDFNRKRC